MLVYLCESLQLHEIAQYWQSVNLLTSANPEPRTLYPKPYTLHTEHQIITKNPKPLILHPRPL